VVGCRGVKERGPVGRVGLDGGPVRVGVHVLVEDVAERYYCPFRTVRELT
jgi:hypothetical protein